MKKLYLVVIILFLPLMMLSAENFSDVHVIRVYDGDTFFVNINTVPEVFGKNIGVRVRGIDTPEIRGSKCDGEKALAYKARDYVREVLSGAQQIDLLDVGRDKYFRILATVRVDGTLLSDLLLAQRLAVSYDGGTKQSWCG